MARALRLLVATAGAAAVAAGCGGDSEEDDVRAALGGFARAIQERDYQAICDRYFAPSLVSEVEQVGVPCEVAVRPEISSTRDPSLVIQRVEVQGERATARVRTDAANQPPSEDTVTLVRTRDGWRIAALAETPPPER